jgi:hypothetical protein
VHGILYHLLAWLYSANTASCCFLLLLLLAAAWWHGCSRPTQTPSQPTQSRVLHRLQSPKLLPAFGDQYISLSIPLMTHPSFPSFSASFLELLSNSLLTPFTCPSNKNLFELSPLLFVVSCRSLQPSSSKSCFCGETNPLLTRRGCRPLHLSKPRPNQRSLSLTTTRAKKASQHGRPKARQLFDR